MVEVALVLRDLPADDDPREGVDEVQDDGVRNDAAHVIYRECADQRKDRRGGKGKEEEEEEAKIPK